MRRRGAGGVGIRRVAGGIGGAYPIVIGGRGAQAAVRMADCRGAGDGDLRETDVVGRALDLDAGLVGRGVGPGQVDLAAARCGSREVGGSSGRGRRRWSARRRLECDHLHDPRARASQRCSRAVAPRGGDDLIFGNVAVGLRNHAVRPAATGARRPGRHGIGSEEQARRSGRGHRQRAAGRGRARRRGGDIHRAELVHPGVLEDPDVGIQRGRGERHLDRVGAGGRGDDVLRVIDGLGHRARYRGRAHRQLVDVPLGIRDRGDLRGGVVPADDHHVQVSGRLCCRERYAHGGDR